MIDIRIESPTSRAITPPQKPLVNRTKVQSHAAFVVDSMSILGQGLQSSCVFSSDFNASIGLTSFLSFISGSVNLMDGSERFWKRYNVKYIWGACTNIIRMTKGISDIVYAGCASISSIDGVLKIHGIMTAFKTHTAALSVIKDVAKGTFIVSSMLAMVFYLGDSINTIIAMSKVNYATTGAELAEAFGIKDDMSDKEIECIKVYLSDSCGTKLSQDLKSLKDLSPEEFQELKKKIWKQASYVLYINSCYAGLSALNFGAGIADVVTCGMLGQVMVLINLISRSAALVFMDCPRVFFSEAQASGQYDALIHAMISGVVLAIAVTAFTAASVGSGGVIPIVCMVLTVLIPLVADIIIHIKNDPVLKEYVKKGLVKLDKVWDGVFVGYNKAGEQLLTPVKLPKGASQEDLAYRFRSMSSVSIGLEEDSGDLTAPLLREELSEADVGPRLSDEQLAKEIEALSPEDLEKLRSCCFNYFTF